MEAKGKIRKNGKNGNHVHVYGGVEIPTKLGKGQKRRKMEVIGIALSTNPKVVLDLIDLWPLHFTMFRVRDALI